MGRHTRRGDAEMGRHGDDIEEGQPILVVETDKASVDIPSPYTGVVLEIAVKPGDLVNVGDVLMTF